jgi:hypothetical protein
MNQDAQQKDGFRELLHMQEPVSVPDFLEAAIMTKIEAQPQKVQISISLQSIFILSSLAAIYVLLQLVAIYYLPGYGIIQDSKTIVALLFWVKLCYDLNEVLPSVFQQFQVNRKMKHSGKTA